MKKILLVLILLVSFNIVNGQNISVFLSPHPDDWQLFMNPNAYKELAKPNRKVIFLHITSGDGGNSSSSYYLTREEGSSRAIRFLASTLYGSSGSNMNPQAIPINGHSILRSSSHNAIVYFMRLPDGGNAGGYAIHNYENLQKIYEGTINQISAIDNSSTYTSLIDLQNTIEAILKNETTSPDSIQFNIGDTDSGLNPADHADHIYTSLIIQNVAKKFPSSKVSLNFYKEYSTTNDAQNVFGSDFLIDAATWGVTVSVLTDNFLYSTWDGAHNSWIGKQYYRTVSIQDSIPNNQDTTSPTSPTNLAAASITSSSLVLNWDASVDNVGVTGYDVFNGPVIIGSSVSPSLTLTGLNCNTTYSFTVRARDAANNLSTLSSNLTVATLVCGSSQTPYLGSPANIPGKVENENYDIGGQDVAYGDSDAQNSGGQYRSSDRVDIESCTEGGYNVGWINSGEWLEYTVKVGATDTFDLEIRYAGNSAGTVEVVFSNGNISTGNISLPSTGGWQVWQTKTIQGITLNAGEQIMRINIKSGGFNLNYLNIKAITADLVAPTAPSGLTASNVGQTSLNLSWAASTDNVGVSSYNIFRNGVLLSSSLTNTYTDNNVVPSTTYSYLVSALDADGNESLKSQQLNVTTLAPSANLALNKPTSSSNFEGNKYSSLAVDGINSLSSWWGANPYSQWWQVDLQNEYLINKVVVVNYYDGSRYYRYDIKVSTDGVNWSTIVDFNNNTVPATASGNTFSVNNVNARYIRVNMNYNSSNVGVHIIEFEAYGTLNAGVGISAQSQRFAQESITTSVGGVENISNVEATDNYLLSVYPNPVLSGSEINLIYNLSTSGEKIKVDILTLSGKRISTKEFVSVSGRNEIKVLPTKPLLGTYLIGSEVRGKREVKKIIIE